MPSRNLSIMLAVIHLLLLSSCLPIAPTLADAPSPLPAPANEATAAVVVPSFIRSSCLYRVSPDDGVTCGFLLTREVHSDPTSRIIRLHVLIIKSTSDHPAADPLIVLNGGPGSPGASVVESMLHSYIGDAWRSERDIIYIDQRGTNYAVPSLQCEVAAVTPAELLQLSYLQQTEVEAIRLENCYDSLVSQGINLSAYNVQESAADINDLRLALGYEQVNLYGFSYGTLLAMVVMRDYPQGLRSVILDSVLPLGVDLRSEKLPALLSGLNALFDTCQIDSACNKAYPKLAQHFMTVLERLRAQPVEVSTPISGENDSLWIDDLKFLNHVVSILQQGDISYLPAEIEAAYDGDYSGPAQTWQGYAETQTPSMNRGDNCATGLYYSTICSYLACDSSTEDEAIAVDRDYQSIYPTLWEFAAHAYAPCTFWELSQSDPAFSAQMTGSEIPTLLLSGTYDPSLPPYLTESVIPWLVNGFHL